ncbi:MAG: enoyl-CoA hydratase [Actinobacteria bacterium]|nr:MAG: enoyl-CoA hydratase [Actinomycetota bacterium]TML64749.1 MAG: enoyl-CoA hydratase [Actinomycetota bacterium]
MEYEFVTYETDDNVAVITLNRPEKANAQHFPLLEELNACWERAAADDDARVILLKANGKHFSAGHDMTGVDERAGKESRPSDSPGKGVDLTKMYRREQKMYLGYSLNWRNMPKPSIAAVQGKCIAAGLMLCWPCDIIIAADNAEFSDPVLRLGVAGVEYHAHPWEFGARKAKELLFTGRPITADVAERLGMVNRVVPLADLEDEARALAHEIAQQDPFALMQAKRAVNQTLDVMGFQTALQSAFDIHELGHGAALSRTGYPVLMALSGMKQANAETEGANA